MQRKRKSFTKEFKQKVYRKFYGHCAYCGCELEYKDMQIDHIQPVELKGTDDFNNLVPTCRMCNFYKSTTSIEVFRENIRTIPIRLEYDYIYRLALKYGNIERRTEPIKFFFERFTGCKACGFCSHFKPYLSSCEIDQCHVNFLNDACARFSKRVEDGEK